MENKIFFQDKNERNLLLFLKKNKKRKVLNFLNQHDLFQFNKELSFREAILFSNNFNFLDGFTLSFYLSVIHFKRIPRIRGPTFTLDFLSNPLFSSNKKHFFIGLNDKGLRELKKKFPHLKNSKSYNPPYIKNINFSNKEINKISKKIKSFNPDYVWVGIGSPKQNILSYELFKKTNAQYFVNIGAALDFLLMKKKEAPLFIRELGLEWFYRLLTDFKYSHKKVWKSLIALKYLKYVFLEDEK